MTIKEFLQSLEQYYGDHYNPQGEGAFIVEYLRGKSERWLDAMFDAVLREHSRKWKSLPDIAVFESCRPTAKEILIDMKMARLPLTVEYREPKEITDQRNGKDDIPC